MNVPAKNSVLFWVFVGIIIAVIMVITLRDIFLWYFRINELRESIDQLKKQVETLGTNGVQPSKTQSGFAGNDVEIAVAIAAAVKSGN
jgi:hypothetical protein